jgi:hypothetical protein
MAKVKRLITLGPGRNEASFLNDLSGVAAEVTLAVFAGTVVVCQAVVGAEVFENFYAAIITTSLGSMIKCFYFVTNYKIIG